MLKELLFIFKSDAQGSTELLLAAIKLALGVQFLLGYLLNTAISRTLGPGTTFLLGLVWVLIAIVQAVGVGKGWARWRQIAALCANFIWLYFVGQAWKQTGSPLSILVYVPIIVFNVAVFLRVAGIPRFTRLKSRRKPGDTR